MSSHGLSPYLTSISLHKSINLSGNQRGCVSASLPMWMRLMPNLMPLKVICFISLEE
jgi:hypothetical protein